MKILEVRPLAIPEVQVVRFARFQDNRGYFTEHFRKSDVAALKDTGVLDGGVVLQANESWSRGGTVRGLHFQWNPHMGKLVRTLHGRMVDLALDIRKGSSTYGKIVGYDMPADPQRGWDEWIWVPPGFAHGNFYLKDSAIEYFCTSEYSPGCESGISPLAKDIDWSLCDPLLKKSFEGIAAKTTFISEKDKNGFSLRGWGQDRRSDNFLFKDLRGGRKSR